MSFVDILKNGQAIKQVQAKSDQAKKLVTESLEQIKEAQKPEEILRGNNYKIRQITPTSFGTQISFAKKYNKKEIIDLLGNFKLKFKDKEDAAKEIFIIE